MRFRTYEVLKEEVANPQLRWAYLPYSMHMAGPREAIQVCDQANCQEFLRTGIHKPLRPRKAYLPYSTHVAGPARPSSCGDRHAICPKLETRSANALGSGKMTAVKCPTKADGLRGRAALLYMMCLNASCHLRHSF